MALLNLANKGVSSHLYSKTHAEPEKRESTMIRQGKDQRSQRHESLNQNRLMKKRCARPLAHCGRMTKTELTCNLIDSVLEERTPLQAETEKGSARGHRMKPFGGCAFREHRRSSASLLLPSSPIFPHEDGLVDPQLRASNDIHAPSKLARSRFRDGG